MNLMLQWPLYQTVFWKVVHQQFIALYFYYTIILLDVYGGLPAEGSTCVCCLIIICCNTAARGLTDIHAPSEGECGYISKTLSMSVLQHLCNSCKLIMPDVQCS